jgi:membrane-bound lytic murein transglycosylase D
MDSDKIFRVSKHRHRKGLAGRAIDPKSYDNLWDRLFDRFELPDIAHYDIDRELNWFLNHPSYIDRVQTRAEPFLYSIVKQLEKHQLPGELALLPVIESAFQPHAVSTARAAGIWQFIPSTGRHYGLKQSHSYDGRRDIYASTRAAIKYLKKLHNDFNGDWLLAIAAYNCGEGAVSRAVQRNLARGLPTDFWSLDLPQETRSYVPRLLAVSKLFYDADQYGVDLHPIPNLPLYKTVKLNTQMDLALAADAADMTLDQLFELNPGFKRQQVDLEGSYRLFIPARKKTRDFKAELARLAGEEGYSVKTDAPAEPAPAPAEIAQAPAASPLPRSFAPPAEEPRIAQTERSYAPPPVQTAPVQAYAPAPVQAIPVAVEAASAPIEPPGEFGRYAPPVITAAYTPDAPPKEAVRLAETQPELIEPPAYSTDEPPPREIDRDASPKDEYIEPPPQVRAPDAERVAPSEEARERPPIRHAVLRVNRPERAEPQTPDRRAKERAAERPAKETASAKTPAASHEPALAKAGKKEVELPGQQSAYMVQPGDTAFSIAHKNGMDLEQFKKLNRIAADNHIESGSTVTVWNKDAARKLSLSKSGAGIKPSQSLKYTVREGDSVFAISKRFKVTVADLRKWNGTKVDKQFKPGVNLTIPGDKD